LIRLTRTSHEHAKPSWAALLRGAEWTCHNLGRELINLLDGQLTRVRYVLPIADVLLRSSETTLWAKIVIAPICSSVGCVNECLSVNVAFCAKQ
jgi:hypothetical protein